jgi:hypothetical protein
VTNSTITGKQVCKQGAPLPFDAKRKNVLVVGDSVSIGYTPFVAELMSAKALVQHSPWGGDGGAEEAAYGLQCLDYLLRAPDGTPLQPDVLMFNWGLHSRFPSGSVPIVPGQHGDPNDYAVNLEAIVVKLLQWKTEKSDGTKLLFAITSPMLNSKIIDDVVVGLNAHAVAIMQKHGVPTVDLFAAITTECGAAPQASCFGQKGCWSPHCPCSGSPANCCPNFGLNCTHETGCPAHTCPCFDEAEVPRQPDAIKADDRMNGRHHTCGYEWLANGTLVPALDALL